MKLTVTESNEHIEDRGQAYKCTKENIGKKSAEKADDNAHTITFHDRISYSKYDHNIGDDPTKRKPRKNCGLKTKRYYYQYKCNRKTLYFRFQNLSPLFFNRLFETFDDEYFI